MLFRSYKPGFTHDVAVKIILEGDDRIVPGRDFDPALLAMFARHHQAFDQIWNRLVD